MRAGYIHMPENLDILFKYPLVLGALMTTGNSLPKKAALFGLSCITVFLISCTPKFIKNGVINEIIDFGLELQVEVENPDACDSPLGLTFYSYELNHVVTTPVYLEYTKNALFRSHSVPSWVHGFCDENRDMIFQLNEPHALVRVDQFIEADEPLTTLLRLHKETPNYQVDEKYARVNQSHNPFAQISVKPFVYEASPHHSIFNPEVIKLGMWKPVHFVHQHMRGIYSTSEVEFNKPVILFVHGINDSPLAFSYLVEKLRNENVQVWFYFYPSGESIAINGLELFTQVTQLQKRYNIPKIDVVAHSMGGLVVRDFINRCKVYDNCSKVHSFTSISTPWGGNADATKGASRSPFVFPVWKDMATDSQFLTELFDEPYPSHLPHYLMFGYQPQSTLVFENNDGVVTIESMLQLKAQDQARRVIGYKADHTDILKNEDVAAQLIKNIQQE